MRAMEVHNGMSTFWITPRLGGLHPRNVSGAGTCVVVDQSLSMYRVASGEQTHLVS
jgi:hypothetical protein